MKKLTLALLTLFISFSFSSLGQQADRENPYIEVEGFSETEVMPDEIFISIVLKERYEGRDKIEIIGQEEKMTAGLKEAGIDTKELVVSDMNGGYVRIKWAKKDVLASKEYLLKVKTAEEAGRVFQALEKLKIDDGRIDHVWHSQMDSLKIQLQKEAISNAHDKASNILGELSKKCGDPSLITEARLLPVSGGSVARMSSDSDFVYMDKSDYVSKMSYASNIQFQKIKLAYRLSARFRIV